MKLTMMLALAVACAAVCGVQRHRTRAGEYGHQRRIYRSGRAASASGDGAC